MTDAPAPLTPPECNLRVFGDFPFDIGRFQKSDLVLYEEPEAILAALNLWCAAWHEVPAASVPNDDKWLAKQAGYGRAVDSWTAVREGALRGFVLCSDGRLYNKTLAEKAMASWDRRLRYEWTKEGDRHRKKERGLDADKRTPFPEFDDWKQGKVPDLSDGNNDSSDGNDAGSDGKRKNSDGKDENSGRFSSKGKGREGKGRESKNQQSTVPKSKSLDASEKSEAGASAPGTVGSPTAGKDRFDAACAAAGLNPVQPAHIAKAHDQLREWERAGIDFDRIIIPTIKAVTAESPDPTYSLARFDKKIRHEHARSGAKAATGKPYKPPASPILEPEDEPDEFHVLRAALLQLFGPVDFTRYVNPVRFARVDDRKVIQVHETKRGTLRLMDDGRDAKVRAVAKRQGWEDVW